jgi:hypothetical protein
MTPEDFKGMTEQDLKILFLEAQQILHRCEMRVLRELLLQHLEDHKATSVSGVLLDEWQKKEIERQLRTTLSALADLDPNRATMMSKALGLGEMGTFS